MRRSRMLANLYILGLLNWNNDGSRDRWRKWQKQREQWQVFRNTGRAERLVCTASWKSSEQRHLHSVCTLLWMQVKHGRYIDKDNVGGVWYELLHKGSWASDGNWRSQKLKCEDVWLHILQQVMDRKFNLPDEQQQNAEANRICYDWIRGRRIK